MDDLYTWKISRVRRRLGRRNASQVTSPSHVRPKSGHAIRADSIRAGLKKLEQGCEDCSHAHFRAAQLCGATTEELKAAIDDSGVLDRVAIDRRTLLKFLGLTGATLVSPVFTDVAGADPVDYWGVDSAAACNFASSDCSTNATLAERVVNNLGKPNFWGRYFLPAPYPLQTGEANTLSNQGINHITPITFPSQGRLETTGSTGTQYGTHDGNKVCNEITDWIGNNQGNIQWPTTDGFVNVWLDCEGGTNLSSAYWNAWRAAVNQFQVSTNPDTDYPFFPCIYMNPVDGLGTCNVVTASGHSAHGIWTTQPQDSHSSCPSTRPSWGSPSGCGGGTLMLHQHATGPGNWAASCNLYYCGNSSYGVDLNTLKPAQNSELNHNLRVPL